MATLQDIATLAGVSKTTVSLALNGKGNISTEVRDKVFHISRELGYSSVSETRKSSRGLLAILVHEDYEKAFEWNFIRNIIIKLEAVVVKAKYHPVLVPVNCSSKSSEIITRLSSFSPLGVFSIHYSNKDFFEYLDKVGVPIVLINNSGFQNRFTTVCTDDYQGVNEGVQTLIKWGHKKIAFLDYPRPDLPEMVTDSYFGYMKALIASGLQPSESLHVTADLKNMDEIREKLRFLVEKEGITGIYALDDYLGARIYVALGESGYRIPQDLSLMTSGDTLDFREPYVPQFTTMTVDTGLMGRIAADTMIEKLDGLSEASSVIKIKQSISDRGSCAKPFEFT